MELIINKRPRKKFTITENSIAVGPKGDSYYLFIGYATDENGAGFSLTDSSLDYVSFLTKTVNVAPTVEEFSGWKSRVGKKAYDGYKEYCIENELNYLEEGAFYAALAAIENKEDKGTAQTKVTEHNSSTEAHSELFAEKENTGVAAGLLEAHNTSENAHSELFALKVDIVTGKSLVADSEIAKIHSQNTDSTLLSPDGTKSAYLDNSGTLHVQNISQVGSTYETHAEQVYTTKNEIILREGAVAGLATGEYVGFRAKLYDGANDGQLVFDKDGWARVGDVGSLQKIATIEESPSNGQLMKYNTTTYRLESSGKSVSDFALLAGGNVWAGNQTFDTNTLFIDSENHRIGGGTLNPLNKVSLVTSSDGDGIQIRRNSTSIGSYASLGFRINSTEASGNYAEIRAIRTDSVTGGSSDLIFLTFGNSIRERARILANGNIVFGATSSTSLFQVTQPTTGSGTVTTNGTITLTGTGTQFTNTFKVGDTITVSGETVRTIDSITSDTSLTVSVAFSTSASGLSYTLVGGDIFAVKGYGNIFLKNSSSINFGTAGTGTILVDDSSSGRTAIRARGGQFDVLNAAGTTFGNIRAASIAGNSGATGSLTIDSTTNATKGYVLINPNGGNVGIGTTSPGFKLDVLSDDGNVRFIRSVNTVGFGSAVNLSLLNSAGSIVRYADFFGGITTNTAGSEDGFLQFRTVKAGVISNALRIDKDGNIGIGTTNPNAFNKLEVAGNIGYSAYSAIYPRTAAVSDWYLNKVDSVTSNIDNSIGTSGDKAFRIGFYGSGTFNPNVKLSAGDGNISYIKTGNVGIGTVNPLKKLHVSGDVVYNQSQSGQLYVSGSTDVNKRLMLGYDTTSNFGFIEAAVFGSTYSALVLNPYAGNVGINLSNPTARLHLKAGTATATTAPLKFSAGVLLTTPEIGAVEFVDDGTNGHYYVTMNVAGVLTRREIAFIN